MEGLIVKALDDIEEVLKTLKQGKMRIRKANLSKIVAKILRFKYASISSIMLFDKPDITWNDSDLDSFYYEMFDLFELKDRYDRDKVKVESILNIAKVFSKLAYKNKMILLDWITIVLCVIFIAFEIFFLIK
jgi:uncharacterized Rmd1/YagE family protein